MRILSSLAPIMVLLVCGCTTTVAVSKSAKNVETLSHDYLRQERAGQCTEVKRFEVVVRPNERTESRSSVAEVKARNQAAKHDASHVLLWPGSTFQCDRDGNENATSEQECERVPVTSYNCVMGLGS